MGFYPRFESKYLSVQGSPKTDASKLNDAWVIHQKTAPLVSKLYGFIHFVRKLRQSTSQNVAWKTYVTSLISFPLVAGFGAVIPSGGDFLCRTLNWREENDSSVTMQVCRIFVRFLIALGLLLLLKTFHVFKTP